MWSERWTCKPRSRSGLQSCLPISSRSCSTREANTPATRPGQPYPWVPGGFGIPSAVTPPTGQPVGLEHARPPTDTPRGAPGAKTKRLAARLPALSWVAWSTIEAKRLRPAQVLSGRRVDAHHAGRNARPRARPSAGVRARRVITERVGSPRSALFSSLRSSYSSSTAPPFPPPFSRASDSSCFFFLLSFQLPLIVTRAAGH